MIALFYYPLSLPADSLMWMLLPLCLAVAIVYKTVRTNNLRRLWLEVLMAMLYMVGGLAVLMLVGYLLVRHV